MKDDLITKQLARLFIAQAKKQLPLTKVDGFVTPNEVMREHAFWDSLVNKDKKKYVEK